ncbi:Uncharacterised protein [Vibrio cholerae]|nr:Uncharacterised protein [Vibrio cholerae]
MSYAHPPISLNHLKKSLPLPKSSLLALKRSTAHRMKLWVHSTRSALVHNIWPSRLKPGSLA